MKLADLRRALELLAPYAQGDYCLSAEHDAVTMGVKFPVPDVVYKELQALNVAFPEDAEDEPYVTFFV